MRNKKNTTINCFCEQFCITRATFYNWVNKGLVKSFKVGGKVLIPSSEIERLESMN